MCRRCTTISCARWRRCTKSTNRARFPVYLSLRWPLAIWNALFVGGTDFTANPQKDAQWNRGAYLVEGLGHCGACHTPRGWAFDEKALDAGSPSFLAGANLDGWYAPSLRQDLATGLGGWSQAEIVEFLKTGHNRHGSAYGSMRDVINNSTPYLTDDDLGSIAVYLASLPASTTEKTPVPDDTTAKALLAGTDATPGAAIYAGQCQFCHKETGAAAPPFLPPLAGNPTVLDKDPSSLINIVLNGSAPLVVKGNPSPYRMPQYRAQTDRSADRRCGHVHPQRLGQQRAAGLGQRGSGPAQKHRSRQ